MQFEAAVTPLAENGVVRGSEVDIELITSDPAIEGSSVDPPPTPTPKRIILVTRPLEAELQDLEFDVAQYKRLLCTGHLGRTLLFTPVIGSTQTMLTGNLPFARALGAEMGVVCVAGQQTQGRGTAITKHMLCHWSCGIMPIHLLVMEDMFPMLWIVSFSLQVQCPIS